MSKTGIRSAITLKLKSLPPVQVRNFSSAIAEKLFSLRQWREADGLLAYMSMEREVNTRPVIVRALAAGKRVYLPRVDGASIVFHSIRHLSEVSVPHAYGMLEPCPGLPRLELPFPPGMSALVLVPGLAFDREKNRLGRGKGYYDRFLSEFAARGVRANGYFLGLGFSVQLLPSVPHSEADVKMDAVLTEKELVD